MKNKLKELKKKMKYFFLVAPITFVILHYTFMNKKLQTENLLLEETCVDLMVCLADGKDFVLDNHKGLIIFSNAGMSRWLTDSGTVHLEYLYDKALEKSEKNREWLRTK